MPKTEQKLVSIMAFRNGQFSIISDSTATEKESDKEIGGLFADGWTIREMTSPGPDSFIVLLMEREKKQGSSGAGQRPFGD